MYFLKAKTNEVTVHYQNPNPGKTSWGMVDATPYLKQLGLEKFSNTIAALSVWMKPYDKLEIHKDRRFDDSGIKWSLLLSPIGHKEVTVELFNEIQPSTSSCVSMAGNSVIHFLPEENANLVASWDMMDGSCIFDAYSEWHRAINRTSKPINIVSLRSVDSELNLILPYIL
jgi:hypothetical protein